MALSGLVYLSSFTGINPSVPDLTTAGPELWEGNINWTKITKEPNTSGKTA